MENEFYYDIYMRRNRLLKENNFVRQFISKRSKE